MLLVTHSGMTVNLARVAYIQSRNEEESLNAPARPRNGENLVRLRLVLSTEDSVVAARDLPPAACRFLREAITQAWAEGAPLTDVRDLLKCYAAGAYVAASTAAAAPEP